LIMNIMQKKSINNATNNATNNVITNAIEPAFKNAQQDIAPLNFLCFSMNLFHH